MKIANSIRAAYEAVVDDFELLKTEVDESVLSRKRPNWHYESRVKSLSSFALKLETGRVPVPCRMEDFFACMIVVDNRLSVEDAEEMIRSIFDVDSRRPTLPRLTRNSPETFRFDDLRLYAKLRRDDRIRPRASLEGLIFEVQVKTFLQHAWSVATHDLVYKGRDISWSKSRIAFQVKAMLEHAEASIAAADIPEVLERINLSDERSTRLQGIVEDLESRWDGDRLPNDCVRLAETIDELARSLKLNLSVLWEKVDAETAEGRGAKTLDLSPYGSIVQSLLVQIPGQLVPFLEEKPSKYKRFRVFLPSEIDLPDRLTAASRRVIRPD